jgi:Ca2+-binding RTX toxin-like protein
LDSIFLSTINSGIGAGVNNELIGVGGKDLPSGGSGNYELTGGIGQDRFGCGSVFLPITNRYFCIL